ncbi:MAG: hypothetical protein K6F46_10725 [Desulfovibrio sp.]|nr:hypothetical protein [Desulfovibrio sp.]
MEKPYDFVISYRKNYLSFRELLERWKGVVSINILINMVSCGDIAAYKYQQPYGVDEDKFNKESIVNMEKIDVSNIKKDLLNTENNDNQLYFDKFQIEEFERNHSAFKSEIDIASLKESIKELENGYVESDTKLAYIMEQIAELRRLEQDESQMHPKTRDAYRKLLGALKKMIELAISFALERVPEGVELLEPKRRSRQNLIDAFEGDKALGNKLFGALPDEYKAEGGSSKGL